MNVLVVGAGAVGGYYGAVLARAGHDVTMLARGAHLTAIQASGLTIVDGPDAGSAQLRAVSNPEEAPTPDLVLFAVKSYDTATVAPGLKHVLAEHSAVLCLQNGVDRAEVLASFLGREKVLAGTVYMEAALEAPGTVRYLSGPRRIVFGEPAGNGVSARVAKLAADLGDARIDVETPTDVQGALWKKFVLVCAANGLTALTRRPFGEILQLEAGRVLAGDVMREATKVADRLGIALGSSFVDDSLAFLESYGPKLRSSMLRDIERGRPTEVDALNGYVVRKGRDLGLPTPHNSLIWVALTLHNRLVLGKGDRS